MQTLIYEGLAEARNVLNTFMHSEMVTRIADAASLIAGCLNNGAKIISCGNGGSLCDASHFAEELTGRFRKNRQPYSAIAINDPAYITCVGNDYSFDEVFSRYVEAVGNKGDVLLAISTSGNSTNVVRAAEAAKSKGLTVIGLTSEGNNRLSATADILLAAPRTAYSDRIQEIHIKIIHLLIQAMEQKLGCS